MGAAGPEIVASGRNRGRTDMGLNHLGAMKLTASVMKT